jgi:DNA-binding NtrC family response regulator
MRKSIQKGSILLVDDDESLCAMLGMSLKDTGYEIQTVMEGKKALSILEKELFDVVVTDLKIDDVSGFDILKKVKSVSSKMEVVMITGQGTIENAVEAMKKGAFDYIIKPVDPDELNLVVQKAVERQKLVAEVNNLRSQVTDQNRLENIVAVSPKMKKVIEMVRRISESSATVLIEGESGTGKEVIARAIHNNSSREKRPFVAINCGAMPENLLESELFGHVKGAFTGASTTKKGLFEEADSGTIFLDEIGETSQTFQVKLLRVLQENEIRRVGDTKDITVDVRVLAASNRDLRKLVNEEEFRKDLYYRLRVIPMYLPPLRARKDDILSLADFFLQRFAGRIGKPKLRISREAQKKMEHYAWPGNVRELENTIERALILARGDELQTQDIQLEDSDITAGSIDDNELVKMTIKELEERHIKMVLEDCAWHLTETARRLGVGYNTLWRRMKEYNIEK